jgi:hypothetical protein
MQKYIVQGRLRPGRMLLVDTSKKLFVRDEELKQEIARMRPVRKWLRTQVIHIEQLHRDFQVRTHTHVLFQTGWMQVVVYIRSMLQNILFERNYFCNSLGVGGLLLQFPI